MSSNRPRRAITGGLIAAAVATPVAVAAPAHAVVDGPVRQGAYSFTAHLAIGDTDRACTGSLVAPQWVLTAKRCFADKPGAAVAAGVPKVATSVTVGRTDLTKAGGFVTKAVELVPRSDRDVVLVKLAQRVQGVAPVKVAEKAAAAGEDLRMAGFGRTKTEWVPNRLHSSVFTVDAVSGSEVHLSPASAGAAMCKGDAGGPALREADSATELVALNVAAYQGGCLGETETRTGALDVAVHDLGGWIEETTFRVQDDVTGDGIADLAAIWNDGTLHVYPGDRDKVLSGQRISQLGGATWKTVKQVAKGDFTNDGIADIVAIWGDGTLHVYKGDGKGKFLNGTAVAQGGSTWGTIKQLTAGDFTGDGNADLMAVWKDGTLNLYQGKGNGQFAPAVKMRVGGDSWGTVKLLPGGDFDGDGISDLMAVWKDGTLHFYQGDGTGQVKNGRSIALGGDTWGSIRQLTAGDFTGDGVADLMAIWNDGTLHMYEGDGNGSVRGQVTVPVGGDSWRTVLELV
ncbi:FG-GAP-like repeat-containing protein [Streptomyces sp. PR69]|uniref:FG-GAP-like repeat-containing protein n=1 Tax=Streptomyces sp. PR69 TaxID=2984950 RepID=UPI00226522B9|nr:FG-GAP-like repeat-containing protein [Streptomyces sp. PR69]